jgi:hypothetical protein
LYVNIQIFDKYGKIIYNNYNNQSNIINLQYNIKPDMYLIKFIDKNGNNISKKLIVK